MLNLVGYHATSQEAAESILSMPGGPKFRCSRGDDQWLGDGVYFFEGDIAPARWWVISVRPTPKWAILEARISCSEDALLNLALEEHRQYVEHTLGRIIERTRKAGLPVARYRDAEAINLLCGKIAPQFKVVRGIFSWPTSLTRTRISRLHKVQVQLAVREPEDIGETYIYDVHTVETSTAC